MQKSGKTDGVLAAPRVRNSEGQRRHENLRNHDAAPRVGLRRRVPPSAADRRHRPPRHRALAAVCIYARSTTTHLPRLPPAITTTTAPSTRGSITAALAVFRGPRRGPHPRGATLRLARIGPCCPCRVTCRVTCYRLQDIIAILQFIHNRLVLLAVNEGVRGKPLHAVI